MIISWLVRLSNDVSVNVTFTMSCNMSFYKTLKVLASKTLEKLYYRLCNLETPALLSLKGLRMLMHVFLTLWHSMHKINVSIPCKKKIVVDPFVFLACVVSLKRIFNISFLLSSNNSSLISNGHFFLFSWKVVRRKALPSSFIRKPLQIENMR